MAGALIGGAALGLAFDRFFATFVANRRKVAAFSSDVNTLESTLSEIKPIIEDIEVLNKLTGTRPAETDMLIKRLNDCEAFIEKCSELKRHQLSSIWNKVWYSRKLAELEKSLSRLFMYSVPMKILRDCKKIMATMNVVDDKVDMLRGHLQNPETTPGGATAIRTPDAFNFSWRSDDPETTPGGATAIRIPDAPAVRDDLVGLDGPFDKFFDVVVDSCPKVGAFRSDFESLKSTLFQIKPIFQDIEKLNKLTGTRQAETNMLIKLLEGGEALIQECLTIKRHHLCKKWRYSKKLAKLEKSLMRFFSFDVQIQHFRDSKKTLAKVSGMDEKMDEALVYLKNQGIGIGNLSGSLVGTTAIEVTDYDGVLTTATGITSKEATIKYIRHRIDTISHQTRKLNEEESLLNAQLSLLLMDDAPTVPSSMNPNASSSGSQIHINQPPTLPDSEYFSSAHSGSEYDTAQTSDDDC